MLSTLARMSLEITVFLTKDIDFRTFYSSFERTEELESLLLLLLKLECEDLQEELLEVEKLFSTRPSNGSRFRIGCLSTSNEISD